MNTMTERDAAQSIVGGGPRTEEPRGEPASDMMLPQVVVAVVAESWEEGGTHVGTGHTITTIQDYPPTS